MSVLNDEENLYLKTGNWNRRELDSRQLLYMAADVTLPGTVAFDNVSFWRLVLTAWTRSIQTWKSLLN